MGRRRRRGWEVGEDGRRERETGSGEKGRGEKGRGEEGKGNPIADTSASGGGRKCARAGSGLGSDEK